jgi:hypothetical protein
MADTLLQGTAVIDLFCIQQHVRMIVYCFAVDILLNILDARHH